MQMEQVCFIVVYLHIFRNPENVVFVECLMIVCASKSVHLVASTVGLCELAACI